MKNIISHNENSLTVITLNRPEKRNALNPEMIAGLTAFFANADRPILLRAEGRAFCAGMDLDYLYAMMQKSYEENLEDARRLGAMYYTIWNCARPVIAAVQGPALAGGCGLVTVCDYVIAAPEAKFGYTEAAIGFLPAIVSIFLETGRDLLLSGTIIDVAEAHKIGFVNEVVPASQLEVRARDIKPGKRARKRVTPEELDTACVANATARLTEECRTGVRAFLEKPKR
jgi:methylglutaconyl-CoA hydratase